GPAARARIHSGYFIAMRARRRFKTSRIYPMQWYYAIGDQRHGPVIQSEFERLVSVGTIKPDTLVWRQGMAAWQPYAAAMSATTGQVAVAAETATTPVGSG